MSKPSTTRVVADKDIDFWLTRPLLTERPAEEAVINGLETSAAFTTRPVGKSPALTRIWAIPSMSVVTVCAATLLEPSRTKVTPAAMDWESRLSCTDWLATPRPASFTTLNFTVDCLAPLLAVEMTIWDGVAE